MKVSIDIDCTPEEARRLFGLPDVAALNDDLVAALRDKAMAHLAAMDADALMRAWAPFGAAGLEQMQQAFRRAMGAGGAAGPDRDDP